MASPEGFFRLPIEVRNQIYRLLISPDLPDSSRSDTSSTTPPLDPVLTSIGFDTSIMYTNRQISEEATDIFYRDHLFVRTRFTFSSALGNITKLGLQKSIRRHAEDCPWITMVVNVDDPDIAHGFEGVPVDIVVAHYDMPLLASLLLYMHQRVPKYLPKPPKLEVKIRVVNQVRASATVINKRLLLPLTYIGGYDSANVDICDSEVVKDFERYPPPRKSSYCLESIAAQLSLARVSQQKHEWQSTYTAIQMALLYSDMMIDKVTALEYPDPTTVVILLKLRLEASVYDIAWNIGAASNITLDGFLGYCQALNAARPTIRLLPLCQALELYLRFAQGLYSLNKPPCLPRMLKSALEYDPRNELKLDAQALLGMFDGIVAHYLALSDQLNRSLRFSELSATLSMLYTIAGV
ncbi:MAG: hypothetical protein Q9208_000658 [Pyrenodesmia sp. 3 TL-2023]